MIDVRGPAPSDRTVEPAAGSPLTAPPPTPPPVPPPRPSIDRVVLIVALAVAGLIIVGLLAALLASLQANARLHAENERLAGWEDDGDPSWWGDEDPAFLDDAVPLLEDAASETVEFDGGWGSYRFELSVDQVIEIRVDPLDGSRVMYVELTDDAGDVVAFEEPSITRSPLDRADDGGSVLWHWAAQSGTYGVYVEADERASVRLTVERHDVAEPVVVLDTTAAFTPDDPAPTFPFTGEAGQLARVRVTADHPDWVDPELFVFGPDGELVVYDDDGGGYPNPTAVFVVETGGDHLAEVAPLDGTPRPELGGFTVEVALVDLPAAPE